MTDKEILEKGYSEFPPSFFQSDGITTCFQRKFRDEKGIKYFITVHKWAPFTHPHTGEKFGPTYEYEMQMYQKDTHNAVNLLFLSEWTLEGVEKFVEELFTSGKFDYYEKEI